MIPSIASILDDLRPCFSRQAAFEWFVIIIFGLIIRCDHLGITSKYRCTNKFISFSRKAEH